MSSAPLTKADLARRYGVSRSAITRALTRAHTVRQQDPTAPAPPTPLNPGAPIEVFDATTFDTFWRDRRPRGRPQKRNGGSSRARDVGERGPAKR